jgi:signal transduction histidine kinase
MVALPVILHGGLDPRRFAAWGAVCIAFAVVFWISVASDRLAWLALEALLVMAMVLLLCDGFEGALLVLVALQLGGRLSRRAGLAWIAAQTALLAIAIGFHWSPRPAFLLAPPYFGFQILAFFFADVFAREASARLLVEENARLAERVRISRELHDAVGHHLTALSLNLQVAARLVEGPASEPIETARTAARLALQEVRNVVAELDGAAAERLDLPNALRALAADVPLPRVHLVAGEGLKGLDADCSLTLLRCTQEIVTNAARHAQAQNLWIDVTSMDGAVSIVARDDGKGVDGTLCVGHGLRVMRERLEQGGGRLVIETGPRAGFRLSAWLPKAAKAIS